MSRKELDAILRQGFFPPLMTLFKAKTVAGETVEFKTDGRGYSELLISR